MHFCLIDDDPHLLSILQRGPVELGNECKAYQSAVEEIERMLGAARFQPDVLSLDVMMPDLTGWDLLSRDRHSGGKAAVIFVTAPRTSTTAFVGWR